MISCNWQVFWLSRLLNFPSHSFLEQWLQLFKSSPTKRRDYSYGDSAGITPDFPFNHLPEASEPNTSQM
jgi:hypothetical protein